MLLQKQSTMVSNGSSNGHPMNNLFASYGPNNEVFNLNQNFNQYSGLNLN